MFSIIRTAKSTTQRHTMRKTPPLSPVVQMLVDDLEAGTMVWEFRRGHYGAIVGARTLPGGPYSASYNVCSVTIGKQGKTAREEKSLPLAKHEHKLLDRLVKRQLDKAELVRREAEAVAVAAREAEVVANMQQWRGQ